MRLVRIIGIYDDGVLVKQRVGLFGNAGLEQCESVFELSNSVAHASNPTVQVFGGGNNETIETRSGKQSVDIVITTKKDSRTESPVPWQDCLVIEKGGGGFIMVDTEPEKEDNTDRSDIKKRSLSALWGGSRKADGELLGGTYLTRLTRDLLVALDLKSCRSVKRMRTGEQRGFGKPLTCDILHKRSRRGFSSSRFP